MPTTYAHWRFGDTVRKTLPEEYQSIIDQYRELYDFGVHGPDIFFYYDCLRPNEVNHFGENMHEVAMKEHLKEFKRNWESSSNKEAAMAYLLGFLAHFTLDSYCHGYIDHKAEEEGPSHGKIESQYDRHLLIKDGYDPIKTSVTTSLHPSWFNAAVIAQLFDRWDEKTIYKVLKDQLFYLNLLKDNSDVKRFVLQKAMKAAKVYSYLDLLIGKSEHPLCRASNMRLDKYYEKAAEHYPLLAESMIAYIKEGKELDPYFHNHFCPKEDYKDIPLFPVEEEKKYTVDFQK